MMMVIWQRKRTRDEGLWIRTDVSQAALQRFTLLRRKTSSCHKTLREITVSQEYISIFGTKTYWWGRGSPSWPHYGSWQWLWSDRLPPTLWLITKEELGKWDARRSKNAITSSVSSALSRAAVVKRLLTVMGGTNGGGGVERSCMSHTFVFVVTL